jgi:2-oxoglutarate dehydrogenase E1 component
MYDDEALCPDSEVKRVILCSGKVYYDLFEERAKRGITDVSFLRLEQIYPFPDGPLRKQLSRFPQAEVVWCQEEPENQGAWHFVDRRIEGVLSAVNGVAKRPVYVGRPAAASPATGNGQRHQRELQTFLDAALSVGAHAAKQDAAE